MNARTLSQTIDGLQDLATIERESSVSRSIRRRLWLLRRGFLSRSDALYDLEEATYRDYLNDYQRFVRTRRINGTWSVALSNKLFFHQLMRPFDDHRMAVHGMLRDGRFHPIDELETGRALTDGGSTRSDGGTTQASDRTTLSDGGTTLSDGETVVSYDTAGGDAEDAGRHDHAATRDAARRVVDRLEADGKLVLKWVRGGGGDNVLLCKRVDGGYRVNGDRYTPSQFRSLVDDLEGYLVCEFVEQGTFTAGLYPPTPNTIRLVTMYDDEAGEPFVAAAIQRIGTERSEPVDNFTLGGLSAKIDLETGTLGPGVRPSADGDLDLHAVHPETRTPIEGTRVPGWNRIRDRVLEIADARSFLPYVGWDVVVTDNDGAFSIIEANSYPGLTSIQVHGPLLADDRIRRFYERHGVID